MSSIVIEIDTSVDAAYIRLSEAEVARTVEFNDELLIDLDAMNVAVGIEVLHEGAPLPFDSLVTDYHVRTDVAALLRLVRPDVSSFLELYHGNDGSTTSHPSEQIQSAPGQLASC